MKVQSQLKQVHIFHRVGPVLWAMAAAFLTYSCMYAYRKPITAGTFDGLYLWGFNYKVVLIVTQVLGYLTSKLIGIKVISELQHKHRLKMLLTLIGLSQLALFLFAITPFPYGFIWIFFNGLPLGFIWGIVFTYIEGRRATDILATFLSISFIVSSGLVKSIGRLIVTDWGVSEFWMPFVMGAICLPLVVLSAWMLGKIPPPTAEDQAMRSPRISLNKAQRWKLFQAFAFGLSLVLIANMVMTVGRDIKDNFLVEIFRTLEIGDSVKIYSQTETMVGLVVLAVLSLMVLVRGNRTAFVLIHVIMLAGFVTMLVATYLLSQGGMSPLTLIILHGVGLYTAYIVFQSLYFERFLATFRLSGNVGFLIYLSDFVGYLMSCIVLIAKEIVGFSTEWDKFFFQVSYAVGILGLLSTVAAMVYFTRKKLVIL